MDEERLTVDAYVVHFLTKSVHTILTARIPNLQASYETTVDRWFNFPIREMEGVKNTLREWKGTPHASLVIKILYRSLDEEDATKIALEVWKLEYDNIPARPLHASLSYQDDACALYKTLIVLVRVLYAFLRTLPAHHLFRSATGRSQFTLDFEVEVDEEHAASLGPSSQWKEVLATDTSGGRVSIHVLTHDITDLLQKLERRSRRGSSTVSDDWIMFAPKSEEGAESQEVFNPVMAHFKVSFESMRSAMTTFLSQKRSFKKTFSFPQSRRASRTADESPEEADIYVFLAQLRGTRWPENADDTTFLSVSQGRALLSLYKQRRSTNDPSP